MMNLKRAIDTKGAKSSVVEIKKLYVDGYKDLDISRYIVLRTISSRSGKKIDVLNVNVPETFYFEQPSDIIQQYEGEKKTNEEVLSHCILSPDGKYLLLEIGHKPSDNDARGWKDVKPILQQKYGDIEIHAYKFIVHRYDMERNNEFWLFEIQNEEKDIFLVDYESENQLKNISHYFQRMSRDIKKTRTLREYLYRYHTKSKPNNYKGYIKVSEIPKAATGARKTLVDLLEYINKYGSNKYGENTLSVFVGWLRYFNENKTPNDPIKETVGYERGLFKDAFCGIQDIMFSDE